VIKRLRSWMMAHRVGGLGWWLSILWVGLGAAGSSYIFFLSTHLPAIPTYSHIPGWVGEPGVILTAGYLGAVAWLVLTIPVLVAGLVRLREAPWTGWWAVAWVAGLALILPVADWQTSAHALNACNNSSGCILIGYSHAVVAWRELPVGAAFLTLGAVMTRILAGPAQPAH
jgi:uncharacterized membrane protein YhaH (DUF805 family)